MVALDVVHCARANTHTPRKQGEEVRVTSLSLHQVNFTQPTHPGHTPKRSLVTSISRWLSYTVPSKCTPSPRARIPDSTAPQLPVNRGPPIFARYFVLRGRRKKTARPIGRRRTDADRPAIIDPLFIQETLRDRSIGLNDPRRNLADPIPTRGISRVCEMDAFAEPCDGCALESMDMHFAWWGKNIQRRKCLAASHWNAVPRFPEKIASSDSEICADSECDFFLFFFFQTRESLNEKPEQASFTLVVCFSVDFF